MQRASMWIVRIALAMQFMGILAVVPLQAAEEQPRAMWMAEWIRPDTDDRAIGVLRLRDGKLTFAEQLGKVDWMVELSDIKRVASQNKALATTLANGNEYVVSVMEANLTPASPKKAMAALERAIQTVAAVGR